jgi:hypothetical protein
MIPLRRRDAHARCRQLLSLRLDEPLALDAEWALTVHLAACDRCRAAERDFREQRRLLRGLGQISPPRDLGARTSAALDREVLRHPGSFGGGRVLWPAGSAPGRRTVAGTSAAVTLAVVFVGALSVLSGLPLAVPDPTRLRPTPLAVPGQAFAYVGAGPNGLAVYRTSVDRVCPLSATDCVEQHDEGALLALSRPMLPSSLALSPSGERLAISAHDAEGQEDVFAVVLMAPATTPTPAIGAATATPAGPPATSSAVAPPQSTSPDTEPSQNVAPTPVLATISVPPALSPAFTTPADSPLPTSAALTIVAILEDVRAAGAAPAWSADGSTLAFSAMPADGRHGPDLYVWQPGDQTARAVTSDHATYFASWSGERVVVSRVSVEPATEGSAQVADAETLVIEPQTGHEVAVEGPPMWLPQVNGPRSHAVFWHGTLEWTGTIARPATGELFLIDWRLLDPFVAGQPTDTPSPTAPAASDEPTDEPTPEPSQTAEPTEPAEATPTTPATRPSSGLLTLPPDVLPTEPPGSPAPASGAPAPPGTRETSAPDIVEPTPAPTAEPPALELVPLEPARDSEAQPVLDWEVRWAADGTAFGFWIADVPGASWGRLAVVPLDTATGELGLDEPLLAPTLARRSFTLGHSRVAWVGPAEATPDGELRISVWGPDGPGVLHFTSPDLLGVLAAF